MIAAVIGLVHYLVMDDINANFVSMNTDYSES